MPTFNELLASEPLGAAWLLEVSLDNFVTAIYRWSNITTKHGGNDYQGRIAKLGKISRGFGTEAIPRAGMVSLLLDNTDFGADWLVNRATVISQVFRARFRLTLALYAPSSDATLEAPAYQTKVIGTFKCDAMPQRDVANVSVELVDDTMGFLNELRIPPTLRDWKDDAGSDSDNCPIHADFNPTPATDWDVPIQLAWGHNRVKAITAAWELGVEVVGASPLNEARAIIVCATSSTDAVDEDTDVQHLYGTYAENVALGNDPKWPGSNMTIEIPRSYVVPRGSFIGTEVPIWEPKKSETITKDGGSWKILWLHFHVAAYASWWRLTHPLATSGGGSDGAGGTTPFAELIPLRGGKESSATIIAAFAYFTVTGYPLSARTRTDSVAQFGTEVLQDLIGYYSKGSASDIDAPSFAAAAQVNNIPVSGTVLQPRTPIFGSVVPQQDALAMGSLRQMLSDICASIDIDLYATWSGKIGAAASWFNFDAITETRVSIPETRCRDVVERIPSPGERWAPYNRLFIIGPDGQSHGPFDNQDAIDEWAAIRPRTIQGKWLVRNPNIYSTDADHVAWQTERRLESVIRPVLRFTTDREALQFELGDLFNFTWTRGGASTVYDGATFRVEGMSVNPENLEVDIQAVWVDDINDTQPFLLDDEDMVVRWDGSGGGTATVQDGSEEVTLSIGGLTAAGVEAGDIFEMRDTTQADNVFTRFRQMRIVEVLLDDMFSVDNDGNSPIFDFDAAAPTAIAAGQWRILRGATTYHTSSSDPTNYPSGGDMYGKACNDDDEFSDTSAANRLL